MDSALPFSMDQRPCVDYCCLQRGLVVASAVDMLQRFFPFDLQNIFEGGNYHWLCEYTESWEKWTFKNTSFQGMARTVSSGLAFCDLY